MKVFRTNVPSICIGNITVGGTGKTPHTEMILRLLSAAPGWRSKYIAVLSRGYKRKGSGFLEVTAESSARLVGDEPLQIKKKFPMVTVAVDKDRVRGSKILCGADGRGDAEEDWSDDLFASSNRPASVLGKADLIILEDAFQYRRIKAHASIVMVDYSRPIFNDNLLPVGRLRDLPSRLSKADIVIVSKCPSYICKEERDGFAAKLGFRGPLFFTSMFYDDYEPVFPDANPRYTHAKRVILFSGIANDENLVRSLGLKFRVVKHFEFGDHHKYAPADIRMIRKAAEMFPTAAIMTTEKDAQRVLDCPGIPAVIRERLFYVPIRPDFLTAEETERFTTTLLSYLH